MEIILKNNVRINNATKEVVDFCERNLVLKNPEYHKKRYMGYYTGSTPPFLVLYQSDGKDLLLPFGAWRSVFKKFEGQFTAKSEIAPMRKFDYRSNVQLYSYQQRMKDRILKYKNGVIVMPCGSGKTQTALDAVATIGGKTLWLTHTKDLLQQSKKRAESCFDCDHKTFGTITDGKVQIGESITFATVQTLSKMELADIRDSFDVVIVDECQHCAGSPTKVTMFYKVLSQLSARYKIGLTATPKRADGLEKAMFALLGEMIGSVAQEEIEDRTCPVEIRMIKTDYEPLMNSSAFNYDGTVNYTGLIEDLTQNAPRFEQIMKAINKLHAPTIVLANRVSYLQRMQEQFIGRSVCLSGMKPTKENKAKRDSALARLNAGEIDAVFCTYQLAAEGLDVPNLRYIVFATPEKDPTRIQQSCGRVARKSEGKKKGVVIDFVDKDFGMFLKWSNQRKNLYKKLGYVII
ncbi:MAG: DEAD/DEAH box helicase [Clostridia bacterium]|nr:DEAD/DEAH box helicase [Clostridia bacterium]